MRGSSASFQSHLVGTEEKPLDIESSELEEKNTTHKHLQVLPNGIHVRTTGPNHECLQGNVLGEMSSLIGETQATCRMGHQSTIVDEDVQRSAREITNSIRSSLSKRMNDTSRSSHLCGTYQYRSTVLEV